jgi:hypothetical protein
MSTKTKAQSEPKKNTAKSQAPTANPPAGAATITAPEAGDLKFDLGGSVAMNAGPVVTITTPTPNEPAMRERFERVASVEIEASALMPGIACPFTNGCAERGGKVRILSDVTTPRKLEDGRTAVQRVQQLHCRTCGCVAKGVKQIGGIAVGGARLFNRLTGKSE